MKVPEKFCVRKKRFRFYTTLNYY